MSLMTYVVSRSSFNEVAVADTAKYSFHYLRAHKIGQISPENQLPSLEPTPVHVHFESQSPGRNLQLSFIERKNKCRSCCHHYLATAIPFHSVVRTKIFFAAQASTNTHRKKIGKFDNTQRFMLSNLPFFFFFVLA